MSVNNQITPNSEETTVYWKLEKSKSYRQQFKKIDPEGYKTLMMKFAMVLSDRKLLRETYLTTNWAQNVISAIQDYSKGCHDTKEGSSPALKKKRHFGRMISRSEDVVKEDSQTFDSINLDLELLSDSEEEEEEDEDDFDSPEHLEIQKTLLNKDKLRIKIIVTEITHSKGTMAIREFLSPLLSKTKFQPELGMFHSALMIGAWKLEWNDAGLCIPRHVTSSNALIACDLTDEFTLTGTNIDDIADTIADVVVRWNVSKEYKNIGGDGDKSGNCQQFVDDILDAIGIDKKVIYKGAMGTYLERLKKKGKGSMKFVLEEDFKRKFNIPSDQKSIKFNTHTELDQFVLQLLEIDPLADIHYESEFKLLKSFDRAFWLRHMSESKSNATSQNPNWHPYYEEQASFDGIDLVMKCPFGDPKEKYSFVYESK